MYAFANNAHAKTDILSPYHSVLFSWLRRILAAIFLALLIVLLKPLVFSSMYANTYSNDVQANAPPGIQHILAYADETAVAPEVDQSGATAVVIDNNSAITDTLNEQGKQENLADDLNSIENDSSSYSQASTDAKKMLSDSDGVNSTENDSSVNTNTGTSTGEETNTASQDAGSIATNDAGTKDANVSTKDTVSTTITPGTDSTAITVGESGNATAGRDYQSEATAQKSANQSVTITTDASSTSTDSGGEGNAGSIAATSKDTISTAATSYGTIHFDRYYSGVTALDYTVGTLVLVGLNDDPIFSADKTYLTLASSTPSLLTNILPRYYRYGYTHNGWVARWTNIPNKEGYEDYQGQTLYFTSTGVDTGDDITSEDSQVAELLADGTWDWYPIWNASSLGAYFVSNGQDTYIAGQIGKTWTTTIAVPTDNSQIILPNNSGVSEGATFKNWYFEGLRTVDKGVYAYESLPSGSVAVTGNETFGQLFNAYYRGTSVFATINETFLMGYGNNFRAFPVYSSATIEYKITYKTGSSEATGSDSTKTVTSAQEKLSSDSDLGYSYTGHTFGGWTVTAKDDSNNTVTVSFNSGYSNPLAAGLTIATGFSPVTNYTYTFTAVWNEITYDINWLAYYGTGIKSGTTNYNKTQSDAITWNQVIGAAPTTSGYAQSGSVQTYTDGNEYDFQGWYFDVNGTSAWQTATGVSTAAFNTTKTLKDLAYHRDDTNYTLNIYAIWKVKAKTYTITYAPGSGTTTGGNTQTIVVDTSVSPTTYTDSSTSAAATYRAAGNYGYHTLDYWKDSSNNHYAANAAVTSLTGNLVLTAVWKGNSVTVNYKAGSGVGPSTYSPTLPSSATATIDSSYTFTTLTTSEGYTFAGWTTTSGGSTLLGTKSGTTQTWTPTNVTSIDVYASWTPIQYTIRYHANGGYVGSSTTTYDYDVTANAAGNAWTWNDAGLVTAANQTVKRNYYKLKTTGTWTTTASGGTTVTDTTQINALTADSSQVIHLYAQWDPVQITINYVSADSVKGKAWVKDSSGNATTATSETINLANGAIGGGVAVVTDAKYKVTGWTSEGYGSSSVATITPTLATLQAWYTAHNGQTTYEFKANFDYEKFAYYVDVYAEDENGNFSIYGATSGHSYYAASGTTLTETAGTVINASSATINGSGSYNLTTLLFPSETTGSTSFASLYTLYGHANSKTSLTVSTDITKNAFVLYYKRNTFAINAEWAGSIPSALSGSAALATTYLPATTAGIRWGQTVTMTNPSATGYSFKWSANTPASGFTTTNNTAFTMTAAGMAALGNGNTAMIDGTWTPIKHTVTISNPYATATYDAVAGLTLGGSAFSKTTKTISNISYDTAVGASNVPTYTDISTYTYYFSGWKATDSNDSIIYGNTYTSAQLAVLKILGDWDFTAVFEPKLVIVYNPGTNSSGWSSETKRLGTAPTSTDTIGGYSDGAGRLSGTAFDTNSKPKAKAGYQFKQWIDQNNNYYGSYTDPMTALYGINLTGSFTFTAEWEALDRTITYYKEGRTNNNASFDNTANLAVINVTDAVLQKTAKTDSTFTLAQTVSGYDTGAFTLYGWNTEADGTGTTYTLAQTPTMAAEGMSLWPIFRENTITITYQVGGTSPSGSGTVDGGSSVTDTVFVRNHNGVNANGHSAAESTVNGYTFVEWQRNSAQISTVKTLTSAAITTDMSSYSDGNGNLTGNQTYIAVFDALVFEVIVNNTDSRGSVTIGTNNKVKVTYNGNSGYITATPTITNNTGYVLDHWTVTGSMPDGTTITGPWTGTDTYKGLQTHAVLGNITLEPVFKAAASKDYVVYIKYVLGSAAAAAQANYNVAWTEVALSGTNVSPAQNGYDFTRWYADAAGSNSVEATETFENLNTRNLTTIDSATGKPIATLYAFFTAIPYTVHFDLYGNKAQGVAYSAEAAQTFVADLVNVEWNDTVGSTRLTLPVNPVRAGFTFDYWYATPGPVSAANATTISNITLTSTTVTFGSMTGNNPLYNEITLRAHWTPVTISPVTYSYGAYTGAPSNVVKTVAWDARENFDTYALSGNEPTRTNYVFQGWTLNYKKSDGTAASQQTITKTNPASTTIAELLGNDVGATNIALSAIWKEGVSWHFVDVYLDASGNPVNLPSTTEVKYFTDGADGDVITFYDGTSYNTGYGTPNVGSADHEHLGYKYSDAYQQAHGSYTYTLDASKSENPFYIYYEPISYTVYYYDYDNKSTPLRGSTGKDGGNQVFSTATWDSTSIYPNPSLTLPSGVDHIDWYYEDPANAGTYLSATGKKVSDILGTAGASLPSFILYGDYVPLTVSVNFMLSDSSMATLTGTAQQTPSATDAADAVSPVTVVAKSGYQFDGWYYIVSPASGYTPVAADFTNGTLAPISATYGTVSTTPGTISATDASVLQALKFALAGSTDTSPVWQNILYVAKFSAKTYTITLDPNNGANPVTYTGPLSKIWTDTFAIGDPTRSGYAFQYWTSSANSAQLDGTTSYATSTLGDANGFNTSITLTASWKSTSGTVTYSINGYADASWNAISGIPVGDEGKPEYHATDSTVNLRGATTVSRPGWTLSGWTDGTTTYTFPAVTSFTMPASSVTLTPVWNQKEYNVVFDRSNTAVSGVPADQPASPAVLHWVDTVDTSTPTYEGYVFNGWTVKETNASGATVATGLKDASYTFSALALQDTAVRSTLYLIADWTPRTYTVVFDSNGGTLKNTASLTVTWNELFNIPTAGTASAPTKLGSAFESWKLVVPTSLSGHPADEYTVIPSNSTEFSTCLAAIYYAAGKTGNTDTSDSSITIKAFWSPYTKYYVRFDAGTDSQGNAITVDSNPGMPSDLGPIKWDTNTIDASAPTSPGLKFDGWTVKRYDKDNNDMGSSSVVAGTGYTYSALAGAVNDEITTVKLVAKWIEPPYRIKYADSDSTTGTMILADTKRENATWNTTGLASTTDPAKAGYVFAGWSTDSGQTATKNVDASTKYASVAAAQGVLTTQYVGATGDTGNYGITLYAVWFKNINFNIVAIFEDENGNDYGNAPVTWNSNTYTGFDTQQVSLTVVAAPSGSGHVVTIAGMPESGVSSATKTFDTLVLSAFPGYTYDSAKNSFYSFTLDADSANTYTLKVYLKPKTGYKVLYDANGGSISGSSSAERTTGVAWNTKHLETIDGTNAVIPTRTGYVFANWTYSLSGKTYTLSTNDPFSTLAGGTNDSDSYQVTLNAVWNLRSYNINYVDSVGATGASEDKLVKSTITSSDDAGHNPVEEIATKPNWESSLSFAAPALANTNHQNGWKFLGWSTNKSAQRGDTGVYTTDDVVKFCDLFVGAADDADAKSLLDAASDAASGYTTDGLTLYAIWAAYVPFKVEYYTTDDGGLTRTKLAAVTEHAASEMKAVDGESVAAVDDDVKNNRPEGYNLPDPYPVIASATANVDANGETTNIMQVVYTLRDNYQLVLDYNGGSDGSTVASKTLNGYTWAGTPSFSAVTLTRSGYTSAGTWNTQADGSGTTFTLQAYKKLASTQGLTDQTALDTPLRLYAMWDVKGGYTVAYDLNNAKKGSGTNANPNVLTDVPSDRSSATAPSSETDVKWTDSGHNKDGKSLNAAPLGYHFDSWNTQRDGTGLKVLDATTYKELSDAAATALGLTTEQSAVKLYAQWAEDEIEIVYTVKGSGGTVTRTVDKITAVTGSAVSSSDSSQFSSLANANPGYHFVKWQLANTSSDSLSTQALDPTDGTVSNIVTSKETDTKITLTAGSDGIYHAATYEALFEENDPATLTYDSNGATGSIDSVTQPYGTVLVLSDGTGYTRQYYTLTGWNTKADGTGTAYALGSSGYELPEGGAKLYAQWQVNKYTITIAGTTTSSGTVTNTTADVIYGETVSGETVKAAYATPGTGKILSGWTYTMTDAETGEVTTGTVDDPSDLKITGPVTFKAVFVDDPSAAKSTTSAASTEESANTSTAERASAAAYGVDVPQTGAAENKTGLLIVITVINLLLAIILARRRRAENVQV